jgi:Xaa-Pro aminopeptidase
MSSRTLSIVILLALLASPGLGGQAPLFTDALPKDEFAARRARVLAAIGDGLAVVEGAAEYPAYVRFRQNNQFFYLTGVEVPRAIVLLDGRTKQTTLFLQPRNETAERMEGPVLVPGADAVRLTGVDVVLGRDEFRGVFTAAVAGGRTVWAPLPTIPGMVARRASGSSSRGCWRRRLGSR